MVSKTADREAESSGRERIGDKNISNSVNKNPIPPKSIFGQPHIPKQSPDSGKASSFYYKILKKLLIFCILVGGFLTVGLSRMIMGVHSLDQIIYGYLVGAWTLFYVFLYWRPIVKKHIARIKERAYSIPEVKTLVLHSGLFSVTFLMLQCAVFFISNEFYKMPDQQIENIRKCKPGFDPEKLGGSTLFLAGFNMVPFGIYTGLAFRYYFWWKEGQQPGDEVEIWRKRGEWCMKIGVGFKLLLVSLTLFLPIGLTSLVFFIFRKSMAPFPCMFFGCAIPSYFLGFVMFSGV